MQNGQPASKTSRLVRDVTGPLRRNVCTRVWLRQPGEQQAIAEAVQVDAKVVVVFGQALPLSDHFAQLHLVLVSMNKGSR